MNILRRNVRSSQDFTFCQMMNYLKFSQKPRTQLGECGLLLSITLFLWFHSCLSLVSVLIFFSKFSLKKENAVMQVVLSDTVGF